VRILPDVGLTYDDVLLVPGRSDVVPKDVDVRSRFTQTIPLNIPVVSAAMDTVTEARLAIALAREGGIGVVHKNLSIAAQAAEIDRVKRSESGLIADPITLRPTAKVREALEIMARYHISGVPITSEDNHLVGILTNRDLRFETNQDRSVSELMTSQNLVTTPPGTTLEQAKARLHQHRIEKLLVVDDDGRLIGLITIKDLEKVQRYPKACKDNRGRLRVAAAVGVSADMLDRATALAEAGVDALVVDSSHGHSVRVLEAVEQLREALPEMPLVGGNVATAQATHDLIAAGCDAVKVGIGPSAICTTRPVTGAGVPQLTAIIDCARAASEHDVPIIADGGVKYSGDITKALAAGAETVMIGSLFAGTDEAPGETILFEGRTYKEVRGMASIAAMKEGSSDRYFQDHVETDTKYVPEGIEARVPHKGALATLVYYLVGGLRSGMGLVGASDLAELREKAVFMRVTSAGLRESHVHDVAISKESPNYQR